MTDMTETYSAAEIDAGQHLAEIVAICEEMAQTEDAEAHAAGAIRAARELIELLTTAGVPTRVALAAVHADAVMQFVALDGGEAAVDKLVRTADRIRDVPSLADAVLIATDVAGTA